jgi:hypothetical protein
MLRRTGRLGSRSCAGFVLLVMLAVGGCGATSSVAPSGGTTPSSSAGSSPTASGPATPSSSAPAGSTAPSATPRPSAAPTTSTFWAAATRGLTAAKHVEVTIAGANPGVLRYEARASATIVDGTVGFVCVNGAAYDGQSGFARVPGSWQCGAAALVSGFRRIGQPADSWSASSPSDSSITESVTVGSDGTWTWAYTGISPFLGGRITARVRLNPVSGRILAAQRTDPTGASTYAFDYVRTFATLAVPGH